MDPRAKPFEAGENFIGRFAPGERPRIRVIDIEVMPDRLFKLPCRAMRAASNVLLGECSEPAFDLIGPRRGSGSEVNMEARMAYFQKFEYRSVINLR